MQAILAILATFALVTLLLGWSRWLAGRRWAAAGHWLLAAIVGEADPTAFVVSPMAAGWRDVRFAGSAIRRSMATSPPAIRGATGWRPASERAATGTIP